MKKKLESELMSIAHRILKLKGRDDVEKMHTEVGALYEKLSVLKFLHSNFEGEMPSIGSDSSFFEMLDKAFNNTISDSIEVEDRVYTDIDDTQHEEIMEPAIEKIKDIVAQMPEETHQIDELFESAVPKNDYRSDVFEDITAGFEETPVFEPVTEANARFEAKKSLNDKLKRGGIAIGLNDKIAFIKHLFDGRNEDYDRVLSQINTSESFEEASNLIQNIVKPDYNQWQGKEPYEERFMEIVESKFG
ncbi:hypothetical protein [Mangrovimonas sp. DI 80]|uniref:hypothetical protein n=1 Tax=Mangrovimonas sp. DI 80 TaxID=1779330 RepID=UPI0009785B89|nr:hypothetical protein [Mangrovimonas sp. DI 80]OMP32395.1 hypothetical protein BKM32_04920 [Mangrovimonas sp. DI 80]